MNATIIYIVYFKFNSIQNRKEKNYNLKDLLWSEGTWKTCLLYINFFLSMQFWPSVIFRWEFFLFIIKDEMID